MEDSSVTRDDRIDVCKECGKNMYYTDENGWSCGNENCWKYIKDEEVTGNYVFHIK